MKSIADYLASLWKNKQREGFLRRMGAQRGRFRTGARTRALDRGDQEEGETWYRKAQLESCSLLSLTFSTLSRSENPCYHMTVFLMCLTCLTSFALKTVLFHHKHQSSEKHSAVTSCLSFILGFMFASRYPTCDYSHSSCSPTLAGGCVWTLHLQAE